MIKVVQSCANIPLQFPLVIQQITAFTILLTTHPTIHQLHLLHLFFPLVHSLGSEFRLHSPTRPTRDDSAGAIS